MKECLEVDTNSEVHGESFTPLLEALHKVTLEPVRKNATIETEQAQDRIFF